MVDFISKWKIPILSIVVTAIVITSMIVNLVYILKQLKIIN